MFRLTFILILSLLPAISLAQTPDTDKLGEITAKQLQAKKDAEALAQKQRAIQKDIKALERGIKDASMQARQFETESNEIDKRINALSQDEMALSFYASKDREALTDLLAALQRIERSAPPTLALNDKPANDAAHAAILLRTITNDLSKRSQSLQTRLEDLSTVRASISSERDRYAHSTKAMQAKLRELRQSVNEKAALEAKVNIDKKKRVAEAKTLAQEAESLRELIATFEARAESAIELGGNERIISDLPVPRLKPKRQIPTSTPFVPSRAKRFSDARGSLPLPVIGKQRLRYNALLHSGARSKGVSLETAASAQVMAPFAGRIEYSGPFNGDNVIILNVGGGYFLVMTGLGETFTQAGTKVSDGEPVGLMPSAVSPQPELFLEFRKDRASINPKPWIGTALAKAKS